MIGFGADVASMRRFLSFCQLNPLRDLANACWKAKTSSQRRNERKNKIKRRKGIMVLW